MSTGPIRIVCVDDHAVMLRGLLSILQHEPDMDIIDCVGTAEEAILTCSEAAPDVVLMDLRLPGMTGLDGIRAIRQQHPATAIIVLTMFQGEEDVYRAKQAGASAYLLKDVAPYMLVQAI